MPQTAYSFIMHEHVWIFSKSVDASKNRANVLNKTSCEEQNKKTRKAVTRKKMSLRPRCKRSTLSSAFNASFQTYRASKTFRTVLSLKLSHVKLPKAAFVVHVADLPEYGSLRPALVMDAANRPHTTYETKMQQCESVGENECIFDQISQNKSVLTDKAVRVLTIQLVAIV